jgi:Na+-transporting NADH:ubiquinone oxidoreductase subunit NqrA
MKLRIRGDSIRLRLKVSEVDRIAAGESIVEETHFPDSVLTYRLEVSEKWWHCDQVQ